MVHNLKEYPDPWGPNVRTCLIRPEEEEKLRKLIEKAYPGEGWRVPDERELRIIGGLAELGVKLQLATMDHYHYRNPIISSSPSGYKHDPEGKLTLSCVRVDPKTHGGNPVKAKYDIPGTSRYYPEVRLVRSI
jgi:hypothetical protein